MRGHTNINGRLRRRSLALVAGMIVIGVGAGNVAAAQASAVSDTVHLTNNTGCTLLRVAYWLDWGVTTIGPNSSILGLVKDGVKRCRDGYRGTRQVHHDQLLDPLEELRLRSDSLGQPVLERERLRRRGDILALLRPPQRRRGISGAGLLLRAVAILSADMCAGRVRGMSRRWAFPTPDPSAQPEPPLVSQFTVSRAVAGRGHRSARPAC
jgi:hypothetical protein